MTISEQLRKQLQEQQTMVTVLNEAGEHRTATQVQSLIMTTSGTLGIIEQAEQQKAERERDAKA